MDREDVEVSGSGRKWKVEERREPLRGTPDSRYFSKIVLTFIVLI